MNSDYVLPRKPLVSDNYNDLIDSYKKLHKEKEKFKGISLVPLVPIIHGLIIEHNCKTLLDYGCGKAYPYSDKCRSIQLVKPVQEIWNLDSYSLYDPAYSKYDKLPKDKYDIVICTDVLEHIHEEDLDWTIYQMLSYSKDIVFINVSCQKAAKSFKSGKFKGQNVHISIFEDEVWLKKIGKIWSDFKHLKIYLICTKAKDTTAFCIKKENKNGTDGTTT